MRTIVCFGDSNTHGYDSRTGGRFDRETRWPGHLAKLLGEGYSVIEEGLSGRTTVFEDPLYEGLSGISCIHPILMSHEPVDLFILMLGTNDVKSRFCATAENIARGIERLLRKVQSCKEAFCGGEAEILVIAPPPIDKRYEKSAVAGEMGELCAEKSRELAPLFERTAKLCGADFLDAGTIPGVEMYPYDYMHLSPDAHRALAGELAKRILTRYNDSGVRPLS